MYALVDKDTIVKTFSRPPAGAVRLDTGEKVLLTYADQATLEACGIYEIVDAPRPDDKPGTTYDRSEQVVKGQPSVVWTERPLTTDETTAKTEQANREAIAAGAIQILADCQAILSATPATFANLTQAQTAVRQLQTGVALLAADVRKLTRYLFNELDAPT